MNRIINSFFSFFTGFIFIALIEGITKEYNLKQENKKFVDKGFRDYGVEDYGSIYKYLPGNKPKSVALGSYTKDIVCLPYTAAKIANFIFKAKFGEQYTIQQEPLMVTLINNKVWEVKGKKGACIYIQKADGQILSIRK